MGNSSNPLIEAVICSQTLCEQTKCLYLAETLGPKTRLTCFILSTSFL